MSLSPGYTTQFQKDVKLCKKRKKDLSKLKEVMSLLIEEMNLPLKLKDHKLIGKYSGRKECHIEPDWLLIYKKDIDTILF